MPVLVSNEQKKRFCRDDVIEMPGKERTKKRRRPFVDGVLWPSASGIGQLSLVSGARTFKCNLARDSDSKERDCDVIKFVLKS